MSFSELEIYIDQRPGDPDTLRARVMQANAEEVVYGPDLFKRVIVDRTKLDRAIFRLKEKFRQAQAAEKITIICDPAVRVMEPQTIRVL